MGKKVKREKKKKINIFYRRFLYMCPNFNGNYYYLRW